MKKMYLLLCLFLIAFIVRSVGAEEKIFLNNGLLKLVNTYQSEPYIYEEDGMLKGIAYEAFQEVAKRLKIDYTIQLLPFKRCLHYLERGDHDAILLVYHKKERESFLNYIMDVPMHYSASYIFVKKGKEFKFDSITDLYGKTIGNLRGFVVSKEFDKAVEDKKIIIEEVESRQQNINKTLIDRIDGFVSNDASTMLLLKEMNLSDKIVYLPNPLVKKPVYFAFSRKSVNVNDEMIKAVTRTFKEIKEDGTYDKIVDKYLR